MNTIIGQILRDPFAMLYGSQETSCGEKIAVSKEAKKLAEDLARKVRSNLDSASPDWEVINEAVAKLNELFEDWGEAGIEDNKFWLKYTHIALVHTPIRPVYYADIVYKVLEDGTVMVLKDGKDRSAMAVVANSDKKE